MEGVEVPSFFLCPISLQIMRDPVTLSTGITYDRKNIEQWLFSSNHDTCPITKQSLTDRHLITPNHTLRRLIQAWCVANASFDGIERFPTPRPPVDKTLIANLIKEAKSHQPKSLLSSLKKLKSIVESERNKRCVESSGAIDFLASVVTDSRTHQEEALNILHSIQVSEQGLLDLIDKRGEFIETLTTILKQSSDQARAYATLILKSLVLVISPVRGMALKQELFVEMVNILKDKISYQATKAALQVISTASPWGRNKIKAVQSGTVSVLIELLLDETTGKKECEMMLVVLSRLSDCAEGRAEIVGHAAGIAILSKKLVRVSITVTERAVRIMHSVAKFSGTGKVLKEMVESGVVSKLCLLVQVDCGSKTKEKVKEILKLHSRVWRNSPCISPVLQSSYPD